MGGELVQVFSISLLFQEMKTPVLVQLDAQNRRDAAGKSALFSSAVHKSSPQVFIHSCLQFLPNTHRKRVCAKAF